MVDSKTLVIEIRDVYKSYRDVQALCGISLSVKKGEHVVIVGPNGSGKSTLVKIVMGLTGFDKGSVKVFGFDVNSRGFDQIRRRIGFMPEKTSLPMGISVEDYLYTVSSLKRCYECTELAEILGLKRYYKTRIGQLSQGYRRRLLLAAALCCKPDIVVLDEPYANVDIETRLIIDKILEEFFKDTTALITSHVKPNISDFRLIVLISGRIIGEVSYNGDFVCFTLKCRETIQKIEINPSLATYNKMLKRLSKMLKTNCELARVDIVTFDKILYNLLRHAVSLPTKQKQSK